MNCERAETLLGQFVFDEVHGSELDELRAHVESCAACRNLAGDMRVAAKLLKDAVEVETPVLSDRTKSDLMREVAAPVAPSAPETAPRAVRGGRPRPRFALVIAATLLVGAGLVIALPNLLTSGSSPMYTPTFVYSPKPARAAASPGEDLVPTHEEFEYAGPMRQGWADHAPAEEKPAADRGGRPAAPAAAVADKDKGVARPAVTDRGERQAPRRTVTAPAAKRVFPNEANAALVGSVSELRSETMTVVIAPTPPGAGRVATVRGRGEGGKSRPTVRPQQQMPTVVLDEVMPTPVEQPALPTVRMAESAPLKLNSSVGDDLLKTSVTGDKKEAQKEEGGRAATARRTDVPLSSPASSVAAADPVGHGIEPPSAMTHNMSKAAAPAKEYRPAQAIRNSPDMQRKISRAAELLEQAEPTAQSAGSVDGPRTEGRGDVRGDVYGYAPALPLAGRPSKPRARALKRDRGAAMVAPLAFVLNDGEDAEPASGLERSDLTRSVRWIAAQRLQGIEVASEAVADEKTPAHREPAFVTLSAGEASLIEEEERRSQQAAKLAQTIETGESDEANEANEANETDAVAPVRLPEPAEDLPPPPVNPFVLTALDRFSTFAMDVDTASYAIARTYLGRRMLPPRRAVRMEEFVNAFDYNYPRQAKETFNISAEGMPAPFGEGLHLLKIGIQARVLGREGRKAAHVVFVVDSSGSMDLPDRMPLVLHAISLLAGELGPRDSISLVTYGAEPQILLEATSASDRAAIAAALASVRCHGSTNLYEGLRVGYEIARRQFSAGAINRVILCSDGVANIGVSETEEIVERVKQFRSWGVTLTTAGFGAGSYSDEMLERLANSGDGNYVFIDSRDEARRVFVEQLSATIQVVAKDAKIQVEFAPRTVRRYRLIGYENREIADKDFRNDAVDAGEVGSGQSVTALYEIELEPDRYAAADLGTVYVRYRDADTNEIEEISRRLVPEALSSPRPADNPRLYLAACAAEFAELLRGSEHAREGDLSLVVRLLTELTAALPLDGAVAELRDLAARAESIGLRR